MKTLSKREISELYQGNGIQYRSQNMWTGTSQVKKETTMNNEAKDIINLGRLHNQEDLAMDYVEQDKSLESFRKVLLEKNRTAELQLSRSDDESMDTYSFGKAVRGQALGNLDGLEAEFHQEMEHQRGKLGEGKVYVPNVRAMTGSNSSFLASSYAQSVSPSAVQSGLYRELGVREVQIPDGKFVYPRESAFPAAEMINLNNSNSISQADPTLDSLTLEATQLASMTVLSRNLLAQESVDLENYIQESLMRSMANKLDEQVIAGSGSGANFTGAVNGAGNAETYSGSMAIADLIDAIKKVQSDGISTANGVFVMHPDQYATFINTERTSGNGAYVVEPDLVGNNNMVGRALGVPVYVSKHLTAGQAVYGDFSKAILGFHYGANVLETDPFHDFAKGSVAVRLISDNSFGLLSVNSFCSIKSA